MFLMWLVLALVCMACAFHSLFILTLAVAACIIGCLVLAVTS